jgi:hypothetical protein
MYLVVTNQYFFFTRLLLDIVEALVMQFFLCGFNHSVTVQTIPNHSVTVQTISNHSVTVQTIPNHSVTVQTIPNHSVTVQTIPSHSVTVQTIPSHSVTVQTIPNHSVTVQTIPSLKSVLEGRDPVRIEYTHTADYICIYKGVQSKTKFQHTRNWSAEAWLPSCLCYRPADSSCNLRVIVLPIPKVKIRCAFQNCYYFSFFLSFILLFLHFKNCICLKLTGNCFKAGCYCSSYRAYFSGMCMLH